MENYSFRKVGIMVVNNHLFLQKFPVSGKKGWENTKKVLDFCFLPW